MNDPGMTETAVPDIGIDMNTREEVEMNNMNTENLEKGTSSDVYGYCY